jgi:hypothetical protein
MEEIPKNNLWLVMFSYVFSVSRSLQANGTYSDSAWLRSLLPLMGLYVSSGWVWDVD